MSKVYALYKGDKLIATGTIVQIAYKTGTTIGTIRYYKSPSYKKRHINGKNFRQLTEL